MKPKFNNKYEIYLEIGNRRIFAAALDWPGWCRVGRDEGTALQTLFEYAPRYARVLRSTRLGFQVPHDVSDLVVVERLKGNTTTDFGAPDIPPPRDAQPLDNTKLKRLQTVLKACWLAFDVTIERARGEPLRTGPRGGGRPLDGIVEHVLGSERGYLSQLGGKASPSESLERTHRAILQTLQASAHGQIAEYGPRGGK